MSAKLDELLERVRKLPPMTARQAEVQAFCFTYGNCRLGEIESTGQPGRVSRSVFAALALKRGWTEEEFHEWADAREWDLP